MSDIGGRELGAGIASFGQSLGDGIAKYREQRKRDKEDDAAFGAVGTAVEHLVKQGALPENLLQKYMTVGQGGIEQKRGFLRGLGSVMQFVDQATSRKAAADRAAADDVRSDRYLNLQEGAADERAARTAAEGRFRADLAKFAQPTTTTVGAGSFAMPVPVQPRLSPELIAGLAARHNVDPPANLRHFLTDPRESEFEPKMVNLDGIDMVTTSRNSAMPVNRSKFTAGETITVEPWMTGEDRNEFLAQLQDLPLKQAQEVLRIRRQARPQEFRTGNPLDALVAALQGDAGNSGPDKPTPKGSEQPKGKVLRFDKAGNPIQ